MPRARPTRPSLVASGRGRRRATAYRSWLDCVVVLELVELVLELRDLLRAVGLQDQGLGGDEAAVDDHRPLADERRPVDELVQQDRLAERVCGVVADRAAIGAEGPD